MSLNELLDRIEAIDNDDDIDAAYESLKVARRNVSDAKANEVRRTLKKGDKVALAGKLSPQYLIGLTGTVAARPQGNRVDVTLDHPELARRYAPSGGRPMRVPLTCVEKV
jgi:hypothetical protein